MITGHDMVITMTTEIGKQVPVKEVYEDTESPAAQRASATLKDVVNIRLLPSYEHGEMSLIAF